MFVGISDRRSSLSISHYICDHCNHHVFIAIAFFATIAIAYPGRAILSISSLLPGPAHTLWLPLRPDDSHTTEVHFDVDDDHEDDVDGDYDHYGDGLPAQLAYSGCLSHRMIVTQLDGVNGDHPLKIF